MVLGGNKVEKSNKIISAKVVSGLRLKHYPNYPNYPKPNSSLYRETSLDFGSSGSSGSIRFPPTPSQAYTDEIKDKIKNKGIIVLGMCWGELKVFITLKEYCRSKAFLNFHTFNKYYRLWNIPYSPYSKNKIHKMGFV